MLLTDYLIDQQDNDWAELLSEWVPPLPQEFTVWMVSLFGDVFAVFQDGSVHMLDLSLGTLEHIADSRDHFCDLADRDGNANHWLMIPLVDACRRAGLTLKPHHCYHFKIPPLLGGEYVVGNVASVSLREHYSFMADIVQQTKDLPNGTKVQLVAKSSNVQR